jgi:outer membrane protein
MFGRLCLALAAASLAFAPSLHAETLVQALSYAYDNNPQLLAEREAVKAKDEGVAQAISGWRPTVEVTGSIGPQTTTTLPSNPRIPSTVLTHPRTMDLNVTQPITQFGRTLAQTDQAEKAVEAERARLVATENTVLANVVQAYLDVLRDQQIFRFNLDYEQVLRRQLEVAQARFRVQQVTRTDVSQAEARLAAAQAGRAQAAAALQISNAEYERAVRHPPEVLVPVTDHPTLPKTIADARNMVLHDNPTVIAAIFDQESAKAAVVATRAQLYPQIAVVGDLNRGTDTLARGYEVTTRSVLLQMQMPLYESGAVYSQTRQAQDVFAQSRNLTDDARLQAVQALMQSWLTADQARQGVTYFTENIRANTAAANDVQQEAASGLRTVLDVLNADQELFSGRVNLAQSEHDLLLNEYRVLEDLGQLTAGALRLPVKLYDADKHYRAVRGAWIGLDPNPDAPNP